MHKKTVSHSPVANQAESTLTHVPPSSTNGSFNNDITRYIVPLIRFAHEHYGKIDEIGERFCTELAAVTDGRARIVLRYQAAESARLVEASMTSVVLSVSYSGIRYGDVYVASDPACPERPALHIETCMELAVMCGWLLHVLYEGALVQSQSRHLVNSIAEGLSSRQMQVLSLMAKGYRREAIAEYLGISLTTVDSHRQSIYRRLGVHSVMEAVYAAHKAGILLHTDFFGTVR